MIKQNSSPYAAPVCAVMVITTPSVLCMSNFSQSGTTEDVGDLEDIFGNNN